MTNVLFPRLPFYTEINTGRGHDVKQGKDNGYIAEPSREC
jgi:hypothetical protein